MSASSAGIRARQLRRRLCFVSQKVSFSRVHSPYMTCRRTRKSHGLRSTPISGSLGVVVGLAGVSFLLIRISEISGGRTVSLRCNPLGLSYGQHSTALSPVVLVASQLFRRITSLQLQVTTRSRSAKREEMSSNIPSTSKLYALTLK
jgi:hypothetical protein